MARALYFSTSDRPPNAGPLICCSDECLQAFKSEIVANGVFGEKVTATRVGRVIGPAYRSVKSNQYNCDWCEKEFESTEPDIVIKLTTEDLDKLRAGDKIQVEELMTRVELCLA